MQLGRAGIVEVVLTDPYTSLLGKFIPGRPYGAVGVYEYQPDGRQYNIMLLSTYTNLGISWLTNCRTLSMLTYHPHIGAIHCRPIVDQQDKLYPLYCIMYGKRELRPEPEYIQHLLNDDYTTSGYTVVNTVLSTLNNTGVMLQHHHLNETTLLGEQVQLKLQPSTTELDIVGITRSQLVDFMAVFIDIFVSNPEFQRRFLTLQPLYRLQDVILYARDRHHNLSALGDAIQDIIRTVESVETVQLTPLIDRFNAAVEHTSVPPIEARRLISAQVNVVTPSSMSPRVTVSERNVESGEFKTVSMYMTDLRSYSTLNLHTVLVHIDSLRCNMGTGSDKFAHVQNAIIQELARRKA